MDSSVPKPEKPNTGTAQHSQTPQSSNKETAVAPQPMPKLASVEHLEALLECLNKQPNRFVPISEIEKELGSKYALTTITFAQGLNILPWGSMDTRESVSYLADTAQIMQTRLIDRLGNPSKEDAFMITLKGVEALNQIRAAKHSKELVESSKRIEVYGSALLTSSRRVERYSAAIIILSGVLAVVAIPSAGFAFYSLQTVNMTSTQMSTWAVRYLWASAGSSFLVLVALIILLIKRPWERAA